MCFDSMIYANACRRIVCFVRAMGEACANCGNAEQILVARRHLFIYVRHINIKWKSDKPERNALQIWINRLDFRIEIFRIYKYTLTSTPTFQLELNVMGSKQVVTMETFLISTETDKVNPISAVNYMMMASWSNVPSRV